MNRLTPGTLAGLKSSVMRPRYARDGLRAGIVHLGIGAFARAHLAAVTEMALHASGDLAWGIVGVSLRQSDTRGALAPQGGLYTLALRDAGCAVLVVSSELDEILALADRVIVMNQGRITGELPINACTEARIGMLMVGERVAEAG